MLQGGELGGVRGYDDETAVREVEVAGAVVAARRRGGYGIHFFFFFFGRDVQYPNRRFLFAQLLWVGSSRNDRTRRWRKNDGDQAGLHISFSFLSFLSPAILSAYHVCKTYDGEHLSKSGHMACIWYLFGDTTAPKRAASLCPIGEAREYVVWNFDRYLVEAEIYYLGTEKIAEVFFILFLVVDQPHQMNQGISFLQCRRWWILTQTERAWGVSGTVLFCTTSSSITPEAGGANGV